MRSRSLLRTPVGLAKMLETEEKRKLQAIEKERASEEPDWTLFGRDLLMAEKRTSAGSDPSSRTMPRRDNPFTDFANGANWLKNRKKVPLEFVDAKVEMKRRSREFWRMSRAMDGDDVEKLRAARLSHMRVSSPNSGLSKVKRTLMHSHSNLLRSNLSVFRDALSKIDDHPHPLRARFRLQWQKASPAGVL